MGTERVILRGDVLRIMTENDVDGAAEHAWEGQSLDVQAAAFAAAWGSFSLRFDASEGYLHSGALPWCLVLYSPPGAVDGWGGHTAEGALEFAVRELLKADPACAGGRGSHCRRIDG